MFWLIVVILAAVHFALGFIVTLFAGLSNNPLLLALAQILNFPTTKFPAWLQDHPWLGFAAYGLTSFLFSLIICAAVRQAAILGGLGAATGLVTLIFLALLISTLALANPAPDWNSAAHRYLEDHYFFLPTPIRESAAEAENHYRIHQNLHPDRPYQPPTTGRWYWNYRSTLSGFPEYDAVVVASPASAEPTRQAFLAEVEEQRAQGWSRGQWQKVEDSERWTVETMLPRQDPLPPNERNRLLRVVAKEPSRGVWLALVALERKMTRPIAADILARAMDSVTPNNQSPGKQSAESADVGTAAVGQEPQAHLYFNMAAIGEPLPTKPDWIDQTLWDAHPARRPVEIFLQGGSFNHIALLTDDSAHINIFLHNTQPTPQGIRIHLPAARWMFTAQGQHAPDAQSGQPFWTLTPLMPQPLPHDFTLTPHQLLLIQLSDMTPGPDTAPPAAP